MWEKKHGIGFAGVTWVAWINRAVAGVEREVALIVGVDRAVDEVTGV